jgi:mannosyltransferase
MSVIVSPSGTRRRSFAAVSHLDTNRSALLALTVLAAALRFTLIGHQGYWFDEANTVQLVHFSPGKMLGLIPQSESTPPLYYCVAWVWARVFGFGEAGLRSLSAVAGVLVVPVIYGAVSRLCSARAGLFAAALTACNPLLVWYSQEARSYSLLVLISALTLLAFAYLLERPTDRRAAAWAVACVLAFATHYYGVLVVAPEVVWLLIVHRRSRPVQIGVGGLIVCGLALLPYAINQNSSGHASWIAAAPLGRRLGQIIPQFVIGQQSPAHGVLSALGVALATVAIVLLVTSTDRGYRRTGLLVGGIALGGLVLNLLLIAGGVDDLLTRNVLAIWAPAAIAVAIGLAHGRWRPAGLAVAAALCAIGIAAVIGVDTDRGLQRPDWRVVANALGPAPPVTGRVVLIQHYRDLLPLSLSVPLTFAKHGARVSQLDVVSFTAPPNNGFCWWGSACNLWPSQMQANYRIPGFHVVSRTHVLQFTILRLVAAHPRVLTPAEVARALRTTTINEDDLLLQSR